MRRSALSDDPRGSRLYARRGSSESAKVPSINDVGPRGGGGGGGGGVNGAVCESGPSPPLESGSTAHAPDPSVIVSPIASSLSAARADRFRPSANRRRLGRPMRRTVGTVGCAATTTTTTTTTARGAARPDSSDGGGGERSGYEESAEQTEGQRNAGALTVVRDARLRGVREIVPRDLVCGGGRLGGVLRRRAVATCPVARWDARSGCDGGGVYGR
uniref:Uncharacterized protein n=1 Tax=Plectus sambesii TaxID=2011161 RepID=A0A914VRF8_9BILA